MKAGDIVKVVKQPSNQFADIVGEVGFIEEIAGDLAQITTFESDGRCGGSGSVPLRCLRPETGARWREAKRKFDDDLEQYARRIEDYDRRFKAHLAVVAKNYGVTPAVARSIHAEIEAWVDNQRP